MSSDWQARITVAAVIERDGRFLMVRERDDELGIVINQPAGHLEAGESLQEAVIREVLEETGHAFTPEALLGVYLWALDARRSYLRVAFCGTASAVPNARLDSDILAAEWLSPVEIDELTPRSPLVATALSDYRRGRRLPLDAIHSLIR